jgi:RNA polymerase sigma-70 factor (ECF subfamily)
VEAIYPTDKQTLLTAAQHGDREALGQLLQAYRPLLLMLARAQLSPGLRPKGGASDLVQDAYVDALHDFHHFRGHTPTEFRHWLEQVILHNLCDFSRRYRATGKREFYRERPLRRPHLVPQREGAESQHSSPIAHLLDEEQGEVLRHALDQLSEDDRLVLLLRHRDHLTFEQIARRTGNSPVTVRQRWVRALKRWRHVVDVEYG